METTVSVKNWPIATIYEQNKFCRTGLRLWNQESFALRVNQIILRLSSRKIPKSADPIKFFTCSKGVMKSAGCSRPRKEQSGRSRWMQFSSGRRQPSCSFWVYHPAFQALFMSTLCPPLIQKLYILTCK